MDAIDQSVYFVEKAEKINLLKSLLENPELESVLIFTRTKHGADKVARVLSKAEIGAEAIHGNKSQTARQRAFDEFQGSYDPCADRYGYRRPWNRRGSSDARH